MSNDPWPSRLYGENVLEINSVWSWILSLNYVCIMKFAYITSFISFEVY